jgi:hypothetical protein
MFSEEHDAVQCCFGDGEEHKSGHEIFQSLFWWKEETLCDEEKKSRRMEEIYICIERLWIGQRSRL